MKRQREGEPIWLKSAGRTLANASAKDRPASDFYATPAEATQALLDYLKLPTHFTIYEPACGKMHIVNVLIANGYDVRFGDLTTGFDFLEPSLMTPNHDWIITNPPFSLSEEFIERALTLNVPFAFLLKSQYWHAARRLELFRKHRPKYVLPLAWRPDFLFGAKGGAPTMEVAWSVWEPPHRAATIYDILERPQK